VGGPAHKQATIKDIQCQEECGGKKKKRKGASGAGCLWGSKKTRGKDPVQKRQGSGVPVREKEVPGRVKPRKRKTTKNKIEDKKKKTTEVKKKIDSGGGGRGGRGF